MTTKNTILPLLNYLTHHRNYIILRLLLQPTPIFLSYKQIKTNSLDETH